MNVPNESVKAKAPDIGDKGSEGGCSPSAIVVTRVRVTILQTL